MKFHEGQATCTFIFVNMKASTSIKPDRSCQYTVLLADGRFVPQAPIVLWSGLENGFEKT